MKEINSQNQTKQTPSKTAYMAFAGLFAALTAICSWTSVPLGFTPIPMNLATLAVLLAGGLLGAKYGTISLSVYVLIGAVGAPVFAGFRGGFSVLAGPTGGFLPGYIAAAFIAGLLLPIIEAAFRRGCHACFLRGTKLCTLHSASSLGKAPLELGALGSSKGSSKRGLCVVGSLHYALALILALAACYALGVLWFMFSTNTGFVASLIACVLPFIPGELIKTALAIFLIRTLKPHII